MEYVTLRNGRKMPKVGLGLWKGGDAGDIEGAIEASLDEGYRLFDTAFFYQTEEVLGKSIRKWIDSGKGKREDLFIITKLPWNGMDPTLVEHFLELSLRELDLDYVDLYLIHWPCGVKYQGDREFMPTLPNGEILLDLSTNLEGIWKAMEAEVDSGNAKSIGVSNFTVSQIERLVKVARIPPANNQVEVHAYFQQKELIKVCRKLNISVTAYSPLGGPWRKTFPAFAGVDLPSSVNLLDDPVVQTIGVKHCKSPSQILLRFLLDLGVSIVPKSSNRMRLRENIDIFNFNLDGEDLVQLKGLDKGKEGRSNFAKALQNHPECPF